MKVCQLYFISKCSYRSYKKYTYFLAFVVNCIPYLSVLKSGSNTHRGSNICQVVQQNERNKPLGLFKRRVPKLLNLINLEMVPNVRENQLILDISLDFFISLLDVAICSRLFIAYSLCSSSSLTRMHLRILLHQSVMKSIHF